MYIQRTAAHHPHEAQAVIVAKSNEANEKTRLFVFNPLNGQFSKEYLTGDLSFDFDVKNSFLINSIDGQFLKSIVLFDQENKVQLPYTSVKYFFGVRFAFVIYSKAHIFPKSNAELISKNKKTYVIYIAGTSTINGYLLKSVETVQ
jgi:hypothetical protein